MPVAKRQAMTDDHFLEKPIIILGAARSGTTMLCNLLGKHPTLALSVEPRLTWRYGNDRGSDMLKPEQATPAVKRYIRKSFADFVKQQGKQRLLEKTPSNTLRPEFVHAVFPDAKIIHVIRHGLDSVLSLQEMTQRHAHGISNVAQGRLKQRLAELDWTRLHHYGLEFARRISPKFLRPILGQNPWGPRVPGIQAMMREMSPLEVSAIQWRMCVEATHSFGKHMPKDQFYEFKLEDMNRQALAEVLNFAELKDNAPVLDHFDQTFDASFAGRQRKKNSEEVAELINSLIEPTLQWLGYE